MKGKDLVIFDLDGTLTLSKSSMDAVMAELIGKLLEAKRVAVISGGGFPQFETQFVNKLPIQANRLSHLYLLPTSGTKLFTWQGTWHQQYSEELTKDSKDNIIAALKMSLAIAGFQTPQKIYGEQIEDRGSQITYSALGQNAPLEEKLAWDPNLEKRIRLAELLRSKLPRYDVRIGGSTSIDITMRGVNKAYGIHKLEAFLRIPIDRMVFVGDALFQGGNDYPARTTGVDCVQVAGPEETKKLISKWLTE